MICLLKARQEAGRPLEIDYRVDNGQDYVGSIFGQETGGGMKCLLLLFALPLILEIPHSFLVTPSNLVLLSIGQIAGQTGDSFQLHLSTVSPAKVLP